MTGKKQGYNMYPDIILSDCSILKIQLTEDELAFRFSKYGFCVKDTDHNYYRADGAAIVLEGFDREDFVAQEKRTHPLSGDLFFDSMLDITLDQFLENVNAGKWKVEIVEEFYATGRGLYICQVTGKERFWLYLKMRYEKIRYMWNQVRREWPVN